MKPMIWILEDDADCVFVYQRVLGEDYRIRIFESISSFHAAVQEARSPKDQPKMLIADLFVSDGCFLDWLGTKAGDSPFKEIPFFVVSSYDDLDLLKKSYHFGAKDYFTKPFGRSTLLHKVESVLLGNLSLDQIKIDPFRRVVTGPLGETTDLTTREFQILFLLFNAPGNRMTRDEILRRIWDSTYVQAKTLDVHLVHLRQKLRTSGVEVLFKSPSSYQLALTESGERSRLPALTSAALETEAPRSRTRRSAGAAGDLTLRGQ